MCERLTTVWMLGKILRRVLARDMMSIPDLVKGLPSNIRVVTDTISPSLSSSCTEWNYTRDSSRWEEEKRERKNRYNKES